MNCGCPQCGTLTVQAQKGLDSQCVCPACGWSCRDCLGERNDPSRVLSRETVRIMKNQNSSMKP